MPPKSQLRRAAAFETNRVVILDYPGLSQLWAQRTNTRDIQCRILRSSGPNYRSTLYPKD